MRPPLSPHFRQDPTDDIDPAIVAYLDEHYLAHLPNLETPNPKLLVVFSGGNAVGKSTLARTLGKRFGGLVLENDAVKRCLLEQWPELKDDRARLNELTWLYTMGLYRRLDTVTPNGLIIRDGIIDWYFERILPVFVRAGYARFTVGFEVPHGKALELIKQRGDTPTSTVERFYTIFEDHETHMRRFRAMHTPDIMLGGDHLFDYEPVCAALQARLDGLQAASV